MAGDTFFFGNFLTVFDTFCYLFFFSVFRLDVMYAEKYKKVVFLIFCIHYATLEKIGFLEKQKKRKRKKTDFFFIFGIRFFLRVVHPRLATRLSRKLSNRYCHSFFP